MSSKLSEINGYRHDLDMQSSHTSCVFHIYERKVSKQHVSTLYIIMRENKVQPLIYSPLSPRPDVFQMHTIFNVMEIL